MERRCLGFGSDQCRGSNAQRHAMARATASGSWPNRSVTSPGKSSSPTTTPPMRAASWHRSGPSATKCSDLVDASNAIGPGGTRNAGVAAAQGDLLAFCDADDVVHPGWLAAHVSALAEADVSAGVFDYWSLNGQPTPSPVKYAPPPALALFGFLPAAGSGNLAIRRSAFEDIGGFTPELMTGEDFDLSWRAQLAGYRLRRERGGRPRPARPTGFLGSIQAVHRLRAMRTGSLSSIPITRPPIQAGSRPQDVGVADRLGASTFPTRVSRSIGRV